jgi:16S rRNA (uracil1498-N3)-methyltransferase
VGLKHILEGKNNINSVGLLVGPEGGFSEHEISLARDSNIVPVTLGPRILRTETAGLACLSIIMYELGDMGEGQWREQPLQP